VSSAATHALRPDSVDAPDTHEFELAFFKT
jgi:hypothetical protein